MHKDIRNFIDSVSLEDALFDFELFARNGLLGVRFGKSFPQSAKVYLSDYIQKTHKYKNINENKAKIRFSLYQPELTTSAGKCMLYFRLLRKFRRMRLPSVATIGARSIANAHIAAQTTTWRPPTLI